jgi:hypothetical protein
VPVRLQRPPQDGQVLVEGRDHPLGRLQLQRELPQLLELRPSPQAVVRAGHAGDTPEPPLCVLPHLVLPRLVVDRRVEPCRDFDQLLLAQLQDLGADPIGTDEVGYLLLISRVEG